MSTRRILHPPIGQDATDLISRAKKDKTIHIFSNLYFLYFNIAYNIIVFNPANTKKQ